MKVKEVMMKMGEFPSIEKETILKEALIEMGKINLGLVYKIDIKKLISRDDIYGKYAKKILTKVMI